MLRLAYTKNIRFGEMFTFMTKYCLNCFEHVIVMSWEFENIAGEAKRMKIDLDLGELVCLVGARFVHGLYPGKGGDPRVCDCRPSQLRTGL